MVEFETYDEFETWREDQEDKTEKRIAAFFFEAYKAGRLTVQYIDARTYPEKMTSFPPVELNADAVDAVDAAVLYALENETSAIDWSNFYERCAVRLNDCQWYFVPQVLNIYIYYDNDKIIKPFAKFYMRVIMSDNETDERYLARLDTYLLNVASFDVPSPDSDDITADGRRIEWMEYAPEF